MNFKFAVKPIIIEDKTKDLSIKTEGMDIQVEMSVQEMAETAKYNMDLIRAIPNLIKEIQKTAEEASIARQERSFEERKFNYELNKKYENDRREGGN